MTARQNRHDIKAALDGLSLPNLTVYPEPPDQLTSPSVVIVPATPYLEPSVICAQSQNLELVVTVSRSVGGMGLDELDDLLEAIRPGLDQAPILAQ